MAGTISMSARREVLAAVADRAIPRGRPAREGSDPRRAVRDDGLASQACVTRSIHSGSTALAEEERSASARAPSATDAIKDALIALWEASDRVCGKRLAADGPDPSRRSNGHGHFNSRPVDRGAGVVAMSAATIDGVLGRRGGRGSGGRKRRTGFYIGDPAQRAGAHLRRLGRSGARVLRGRHGGARRTSIAGQLQVQTLTMVDVATGWTECLPLIAREQTGGSNRSPTGRKRCLLALPRSRLRQ